jgi:DNA-binding CsgD family transcriptional regulator
MPQRARPYLRRLASFDDATLAEHFGSAVYSASAFTWCQQMPDALDWAARFLHIARKAASPTYIAAALPAGAETRWWTWNWQRGDADAREALAWAAESQQAASAALAGGLIARFDAARGREYGLRAMPRYEMRPMRDLEDHARGLLALGRGDLPEAADALWPIWKSLREPSLTNPVVVPWAGDLLEALARTGRRHDCAEVLAWLDERVTTTGLPYARLAAERTRGLLAADADESASCFAAALDSAVPPADMPFERARTLLCLGETRRRARRAVAAREPLALALNIFSHLGAAPWAHRAQAELRAAGASGAATRGVMPVETLTAQELQVAQAVAHGRSNDEVAAALFLSPKTVEAHLTRVYRKLAIRSRTELTIHLRADEAKLQPSSS